ncbi:MAG TPA: hypothetical protein VKB31_05810 [Trueperaceae bacterium]|nr:hypothetical protein [Trueperaceae bacterium]
MRAAIADVFIAALELLEAEGRSARRGLVRTAASLALMAAGVVLLVGAVALLAWAMVTSLYPVMAAPLARLLAGIAVLAVGGGLAWAATGISR